METSIDHDRVGNPNPYPSFLPSPTSSTGSSTNNNGIIRHNQIQNQTITIRHNQIQNQTITRSESNPYPTTLVQADTTSFKQVVQMLTGSSETVKLTSIGTGTRPLTEGGTGSGTGNNYSLKSKPSIPPIKTGPGKSKPSKLYERRNSRISPLIPRFGSGLNAEILSPCLLDFPSLVLSPVTPLLPDPFNRSPVNPVDKAAEEKAIAEKGFYLHRSPVSTPRDSEPQLLPLFPVTSPSGSHPSSC